MAQHLIEMPGSMQMRVIELNPRLITSNDHEVALNIAPEDVVILQD
jgi:hypothetical protein